MAKTAKPGLNGKSILPAASADQPVESSGTTARTLHFANGLYFDIKDENTLLKRQGIKRTTEQEIFTLLADGLRFRKLLRSKSAKEFEGWLTPEELDALSNILNP